MKHILNRLKVDRWIAEGAPAFWVIAMSILVSGAALGILSALSLLFDWRFLAVAISWAIGALAISLVACGGWFVVEALSARERPTPWRK